MTRLGASPSSAWRLAARGGAVVGLATLFLAGCRSTTGKPVEISQKLPDGPSKDSQKTTWQKFVDTVTFKKEDPDKAMMENVIRNSDGTWRVDSRAATDDEKQKSGFDKAEQLFRDEQYDKAASAFKAIARNYKDTPLAEEALFMRAEALFKANRLPKAQDTYTQLLTKYPTTRFLPQAIQRSYDIAFYWLEDSRLAAQGQPTKHYAFTNYVNFFDKTRPILDTPGRAIECIETIQQHDPFGPLTDDAVMMAAGEKFVSGGFVQAAGYYEQVVNDQPKSEHSTRARILGAQAYMRSYQGPLYDGSELEGAERLTRAALQRDADLPTEQRVKLEQDLRVVYLERAKRDFNAGEEYRALRRPKAARYCYNLVIQRYPDTDWARKAEEEIRRIDAKLAIKPVSWWQSSTSWAKSWIPSSPLGVSGKEPDEPASPELKDASSDPNNPERSTTGASKGKAPAKTLVRPRENKPEVAPPARLPFDYDHPPGLPDR